MNSEPFWVSKSGSKGGTGPEAFAKGNHHAAHAQAVERTHKGILADTIVNHSDAFTAGQFSHPFGDVLTAVVDDVIAAVLLCQLGFGFARYRTDYRCTKRLGPLAGNQPDPPAAA